MRQKQDKLKKAGNRSLKEIVRIVKSIKKELNDLNIPAYTPRPNGRVL